MIINELRFGVIGWGYWGPKIARNLDSLSHAAVTMVADADAHRLTKLEVNKPWIKTTTLIEDIFCSDVHAIVIATPVAHIFNWHVRHYCMVNMCLSRSRLLPMLLRQRN
jgi:predicted dehydrogenase